MVLETIVTKRDRCLAEWDSFFAFFGTSFEILQAYNMVADRDFKVYEKDLLKVSTNSASFENTKKSIFVSKISVYIINSRSTNFRIKLQHL